MLIALHLHRVLERTSHSLGEQKRAELVDAAPDHLEDRRVIENCQPPTFLVKLFHRLLREVDKDLCRRWLAPVNRLVDSAKRANPEKLPLVKDKVGAIERVASEHRLQLLHLLLVQPVLKRVVCLLSRSGSFL